jgi:hypothetical protein
MIVHYGDDKRWESSFVFVTMTGLSGKFRSVNDDLRKGSDSLHVSNIDKHEWLPLLQEAQHRGPEAFCLDNSLDE